MAGGASIRMGRDKAWMPCGDIPLWRLQLEKLESLADEVFLSACPGRFDAACVGHPVVGDEEPGLGPLGGLVSVLPRVSFDRVVVLAVDMPGMTREYLAALARMATPECGVVPVSGEGYEGLAAVYPKKILALAREVLSGGDLSLQILNRRAVAYGWMRGWNVGTHEGAYFRNWNHPADILAA